MTRDNLDVWRVEARRFVAKIGSPRGAFSFGGMDETALAEFLRATYERGRSDERAAMEKAK